MDVVSISEATAQLASLVKRAANGEDVAISVNGVPVVRVTRLEVRKRQVQFGLLQGKLSVPDDFDEPLPADALCATSNEAELLQGEIEAGAKRHKPPTSKGRDKARVEGSQ